MGYKMGVLGTGDVGKALSAGFLKEGHSVTLGARDARKAAAVAREIAPQLQHATFVDAVRTADIVVLAVKGTVAESVVDSIESPLWSDKVVIDTTNPIADAPPAEGVLQFFTGPNDSLLERLQKKRPNAHFVKAFSCVGSPFMIHPKFPGGKPTMFICGNQDRAKARVTQLLETLDWEVADMGTAEGARAIEPLCQLWCIPGLRGGSWSHAFKLLRF